MDAKSPGGSGKRWFLFMSGQTLNGKGGLEGKEPTFKMTDQNESE